MGGRLRKGVTVIWLVVGAVGLTLFLLAALPGMTMSAWLLGTYLAGIGSQILVARSHVGRLLKLLTERTQLGPEVFSPLTRFPQTSALLSAFVGVSLSVLAYLGLRIGLGQGAWNSLIVLVLLATMVGMGSITQYFLIKLNMVPLHALLATLPQFRDHQGRLRISLRTKVGIGVLANMAGTLVVAVLFSGLTLQSSLRHSVEGYVKNECKNFVEATSLIRDMRVGLEDQEAFIRTLKPAAGGSVYLVLPPSEGKKVLGNLPPSTGRGDILVRTTLPDGSELVAHVPESDYAGAVWRSLSPNLLIMAIGIAFFVWLMMVILRDIQNPLRLLTFNSDRVGEGRIDRIRPIYCDDEVEDLSAGFDRMVQSLQSMVVSIRGASRDLGHAASAIQGSALGVRRATQGQRELIEGFNTGVQELSETSVSISASSMELSLSAESTNATIIEMAASIQQINKSMDSLMLVVDGITSAIRDFDTAIKSVGKNTDQLVAQAEHTREFAESLEQSTSAIDDSVKIARRYAKKVLENAARGMELAGRNQEKMRIIEGVVQDFQGTTKNLLLMGSEMAKIVDTIEGLTQQTNMLALNAAIVASQGEENQNKGFSVVADEIKQLSERTSGSTREVQKIIESLQTTIRSAYEQVERGLDAVQQGADSVAQSEGTLQAILESVSENDSVVELILTETRQQASHASLIHEANRNIHGQAETIRQVMEEQQATSNYILSLAMNVREATSVVRDSTQEQSVGSDEIARAMERVRALAASLHEILAHHEDHILSLRGTMDRILQMAHQGDEAVAASAEFVDRLNVQVNLLNREVNRFKL
jgi:methyl-accepting chemotaxis protein